MNAFELLEVLKHPSRGQKLPDWLPARSCLCDGIRKI